LSVLTKLRNDLVHVKAAETRITTVQSTPPEGFSGTWGGLVVQDHAEPSYFASLKNWQLVPRDVSHDRWILRICTREIAEWACDTVETLAEALVAQLPAGTEFRKKLEERSLRKRAE
jgi:hypothetical protein